ncbi:MAG TPA: transcription termination/antitermination NusG family protein [Terriglobales bacterium]|nr:transcription termination/antitermination NusG family protein [Terriglobales bacterium]
MTPSSQRQWYVVSTKLRKEAFAQEQLGRRGVATFLPRLVEAPRPERPTIGALFPGYLFLNIDLEEQFFDVVWTPGVKRFVGFGALPLPIEQRVIDFLIERSGPEGIIRLARVFDTGDLVRIKHGPFEGLIGIVEAPVPARGRVRVLLELLRRQTPVELPAHLVERVPA